jgi:hypothetical protein
MHQVCGALHQEYLNLCVRRRPKGRKECGAASLWAGRRGKAGCPPRPNASRGRPSPSRRAAPLDLQSRTRTPLPRECGAHGVMNLRRACRWPTFEAAGRKLRERIRCAVVRECSRAGTNGPRRFCALSRGSLRQAGVVFAMHGSPVEVAMLILCSCVVLTFVAGGTLGLIGYLGWPRPGDERVHPPLRQSPVSQGAAVSMSGAISIA